MESVKEGRAIQNRLPKYHHHKGGEEQLPRSFSKLMFQGKTHAALQLLADKGKGNVLHLKDAINSKDPKAFTVKDDLKSKHPAGQAATMNSIIHGSPPDVHPVVFNSIDAALIRSMSLHTRGVSLGLQG